MKAKYVVLQEDGYDVTNGHLSYRQVKTFKNEPDALAFYNDPKNQRMYGELFLERHDSNGGCFGWDDSRKNWETV